MGNRRDRSSRDEFIMDGLAALGLIVASLLLVQVGSSVTKGALFTQSMTSLVIWGILPILPIATRRVFPDHSAQALLIICTLQLLVGPSLLLADFAAIIVFYSALVYGRRSTSRLYTLAAFLMCLLAAVAVTFAQVYGPLLTSTSLFRADLDFATVLSLPLQAIPFFFFFSLVILCTMTVAYWRRARLQQLSLLEERNQALEESQKEQERLAALAERARIARDMHDVVAHNLSIIIVQAGGGKYAGAQDIRVAVSVMRTIHEETQTSLVDMHRLLNTLDNPGEGGTGTSPTGSRTGAGSGGDPDRYSEIETLLQQARVASPESDIHRTIRGRARSGLLSAQADDTVYRVYQEALSNIRKHAGDKTHVEISENWSETGLAIRIVDDGGGTGDLGTESADGVPGPTAQEELTAQVPAGPASRAHPDDRSPAGLPPGSPQASHGFGLIGMRERVEALDGSLDARPWTDSTGASGGFSLLVNLPLGVQPAAAGPVTVSQSQTRASRDGDSPLAVGGGGDGWPHPTAADSAGGRISSGQGLAGVAGTPAPGRQPDQFEAVRPRRNVIERFSLWTQQRVGLIDSLSAVALAAIFLYEVWPNRPITGSGLLVLTETVLFCAPLSIRRLRPQLAAGLSASLLILSTLLPYPLSPAVFLCVIPLYSVVLYGPRKALRWVVPATVLGISAFVHYLYTIRSAPIDSRQWIHFRMSDTSPLAVTLTLGGIALTMAVSCAAVIFWALLKRNQGNNLLLLRAKEAALLASQAQNAALTAQIERSRISQQIHQSVTDTLSTVLTTSQSWLRRLEQIEAQTEQPAATAGADPLSPADAQLVQTAFDDVADTGRQALAQMRELLGVLRNSESEQEQGSVKLTPVDQTTTRAGQSAADRLG